MRVYIAGAMTGRFDYKKYFNEAEEFVRSKGHIVLNPIIFTRGLSRLL